MLVERDHQLAALLALLSDTAAGAGRLVFLGGEAGVGKTTLVRSLTDEVAGQVAIRRGSCDNLTTAAALGPLVEAVPELIDAIESADHVDRLRLFRKLRDTLAGVPTLLVLEDVHWADEATLDMLRVIGRRLDQVSVLVLATFREDEVARHHPLTVTLGDLATLSGVVRMQLSALTLAGVRQLIQDGGAALDAEEVHRNTGGNPFYVTEVIAAGSERVPSTVRDAVLARAGRLSVAAQRVLAAAAILGPRSDLRPLTAVSGESAAALDECVHLGVLIPDGAGVVFRHELARLTIEETLSPGERSELHAAALRELMTRGDADDRTLAHHAAGCGAAEVVRERAPRAAARSARLGAHREAAELYRLALRFISPDAPDRGALCTALSYECYLTDQLADALAARDEAMRIADQAGDHLAVGDAQRWLSRLSWFFGRNDDSEKWAASAIETLEPLGESRELAMAYSNMSQLRMLANDWQDAVRWGKRAIALARRLGDREVEIHALNNVGTSLCSDSDDVAGLQHLAQSLDMALADDAQEHAARAYTNLGSIAVNTRRFELGARHLRAGIAYCQDHDLDSWRLYMSSWLARSLLEQGRTAAAEAVAADTLRHPRLSPISRIGASVVVALADLRRGGSGEPYLAQALDLAMSTGEVQRLVPVAAARAEAAWLAGRPTADLLGEIDLAWAAALNHPEPWQIGDLCGWLAVFGQPREVAVALPRPFALMLSGNWRAAADEWQRIGSPFWTALALAWSPELDDARTACHLLSEIDAPAVRQAVIRDRHARGLPVPRGPRAASRANSWGLTSREIEILDLLTEGLSNAEIAQQLVLSEKTVGHHVSAILRKLGEPTRSRASAAAIRHGIVTK